jgi:anti-anti-sigma factor
VRTGPFQAELDHDTRTLAVSGDVENSDVARLRTSMEEALDPASPLTVDLTQVTYLPSVAIGALVRVTRAAAEQGATLELVAARGSVAQRVLEVCAIPHRAD